MRLMTSPRTTPSVMYIAVLLMITSVLCAAAPKVGIRIVSRTNPAEEGPQGPVPFREPVVLFQGPFTSSADSLECLTENPGVINTESALVDFCHLKNVTYVAKKPEAAEGAEEAESSEPPMRKILGIFRGWKIDPVNMRYKYMLFDDGDTCGNSGERMALSVELVPTKNSDTKAHFYDFKQVEQCTFSAKLFAFVPVKDIKPEQGIHTSGVLDITDAQETLPQVCGQMTCSYNTITRKVQGVMNQARHVEKVISGISLTQMPHLANLTLDASKSILRSSNIVLERSLELLDTLAKLQAELLAARKQTESDTYEDNPVGVVAGKEDLNQDSPSDDGSAADQQLEDQIVEVVVDVEG
uniref:Uncharacterized protein n=1 Tax=Globisporangium ultimum (strain ATCC 200006 / CBS 805.95 / DAOM BR144) TaxID=431595 RepID=K3WQ94_GLOUD